MCLSSGRPGLGAGRNTSLCNAYNLRRHNEAIIDIARAMQLAVADLPEFPPRHRIGIKDRGLILRPNGEEGPLAWSWARWSLIPPGSKEPPGTTE
jgi:putative SOS response-associated peptidase YedK